MPHIQQLDAHVADLIAAGEVVERPASVVKELVENAIDAGASAVTVEVQQGGMRYIRVTDDGCGIAPGEVATAFLRHATSKIHTEFDLEAIGTLGFRGEALAAIASVSRMEILTREAGGALGSALTLEGGVPGRQEEAGCPQGTTMIVRDLFYNTPARQKFMKKDAAEGAAVLTVAQHAALSHPEVSIRLIREGKEVLFTPGDGKLRSALYAVLGRDIALGFVPVQEKREDMAVSGFVSMPACCRGTRACQFFFVNGRYVKSRTMTAAVEEAYRNRRMVGKFPGCVLHITAKLNSVDVNVHPTKTEVKFTNEKALFSAVYSAVNLALDGDRTRPELKLEQKPAPRPEKHDTVTPNQTYFSVVPPKAAPGRSVLHDDTHIHYAPTPAESAAALWRQGTAAQPAPAPEKAPAFRPASPVTRGIDVPGPEPEETPGPKAAAPEKAAPAWAVPAADKTAAEKEAPFVSAPAEAEAAPPVREAAPALEREPAPALSRPAEETRSPAAAAPTPAAAQTPAEPPAENPTVAEAPETAPAAQDWRIVGEVLHTYIIVEQGDTVLFIDKHAAHERMNFDRMKAADYRPMAQMLLAPLVLNPGEEVRAALLDHTAQLEELGFEVEDFGGGSVIVRQVPYDIGADQAEATLAELAEKLASGGGDLGNRDDLLHTMACKAAIKGGQHNGPEELAVVVRAVMAGEVKYCPHGRPVAVELTKKQLEKQFKRA